jgi:TolB protein
MFKFSIALCMLAAFCSQTVGENLTTFPVSVHDGDRFATGVSGDIVVWSDERNGNWDVYAKDLSTDLEWAVCDHTANQWLPAVSGNLVVWTDSRSGNGEIYGRYLDGGDEFLISGPGAQVRYGPSISGSRVVWADARNPLTQIYYRDLSAGEESRIAPSLWQQGEPDIDGDLVVWTEYGSKRWVYGKDLSSGADLVISKSNTYSSYESHISGETVIWEDSRHGGNKHIYMRNAFGGDETALTSGQSKNMGDISGSLVFWTDYSDGYSIRGTNLATGTEYFIPGEAGKKDVGATLDGELIVWTRMTGKLGDVYGAYVPEPATMIMLAAGGLVVLRRHRKQ